MSEAAAALMLGWLADRAIGDPRRGHPVAGFGRVAEMLEARMWRPARPAGALYAGALAAAAGLGAGLAWRLVQGRPLARLTLASAVVWAAVGGRSLEAAALALAEALDNHDVPAARALLPTLAGRDPSALGATELCRAGIESVAENTADAVTGPLLWGALAGRPAWPSTGPPTPSTPWSAITTSATSTSGGRRHALTTSSPGRRRGWRRAWRCCLRRW